jgi:photosystem II stability/assembly factor-like uncharacterized protein
VVSEFEKRLRASLHRHAAEAPDGDRLVERILREASARPAPSRSPRRREWRAWTFPLATAGAVAAIAAALVGVHQVHHSAAPAGTQLPTTPRLAQLTPVPTGAPQGTAVPTTTTQAPAVPPNLTHVRVLDATFVGPKDGWLLATADCLGKPGTCTAMLRTVDGGAHWTSMPNPPVNVPGVPGCPKQCVDHIRFANRSTGYVYGDGYYGSDAFYLTTNGGKSWTQQSGGAVALETLDNNVIRVSTTEPGCGPPGCTYQVQTAAIGSSKWSKPYPLSASGMTTGAQLVRGGNHDAYVLVTMNPAGGASDETSTLFVSTDDGATWSDRGEPCPQAGGPTGEVDSVSVAAGGDDRVSVLCVARMSPQPRFVAASTDHGRHFTKLGAVPSDGAGLLAGDPATVLLVVGPSGGSPNVHRSVDGGLTWQKVPGVGGAATWVGFESKTVGRIIGDNGRTIWTTNDAGEHWTPFTFG